MGKTYVFDNFCDEELEQLATRVAELFGDDAATAAVERARAVLTAMDDSASRDRIVEYRAAVKAELRRLLTPQ
jgi:uncharacterized protein (DUF2267 family)